MEGGINTGTLPRQDANGVNVNMLRGWLDARGVVRRKLMRSSLVSACFAGIAVIAVPLVIWLFSAERANRARLEAALTKLKIELKDTEHKVIQSQPKMDRARKFKQIRQRTKRFVNGALSMVASAPESVVLSSVSASAVQGKLTLRVLADAPGAAQKSQFESRAATGDRVLAAFVTNQTFDQTIYPKGLRFEFVKILEVGP